MRVIRRRPMVGRVVTESLEQHADTITLARHDPDAGSAHAADQGEQTDPGRRGQGIPGDAPPCFRPARGERTGDRRGYTGEDGRRDEPGEVSRLRRNPGYQAPPGQHPVHRVFPVPDCSFNIGLPMAQWGFAVRTDEVCENTISSMSGLCGRGPARGRSAVRSVIISSPTSNRSPKSRPWTKPWQKKIQSHHIYSVAELGIAHLKVPAGDWNSTAARPACLFMKQGVCWKGCESGQSAGSSCAIT